MFERRKVEPVWSTTLTAAEIESMGTKAATLLKSRRRRMRAQSDCRLLDECGVTVAEYAHSVRVLSLDGVHYLLRNYTGRSADLRLCIQRSLPKVRSLDIPTGAALTVIIQTMVNGGIQMRDDDIDKSVETEWFWYVCGIIGQSEHSRLARLGVPLKYMVQASENNLDPELIRSMVG